MKQAIGKFLEKFGISHQKNEAEPGFEGASEMKKENSVTFQEIAKKYGLGAATILAEKDLLSGQVELSHDEWREVYLASSLSGELAKVAQAKMFETSETVDQLAARLGIYSKEEQLYYLVKAAGLADTMEDLVKIYLASDRSQMSEEYQMVRQEIFHRMKVLAGIN